jgi:hypothetical protein
MRDFQKEMKDIFNLDSLKEREFYQELIKIIPKPLRLFNIHKRSLPVGVDQIIFVGLTRKDAEETVRRFLKPKVYFDEVKESKTLIYYDVVPQDATPVERSIFYNTIELLKEE